MKYINRIVQAIWSVNIKDASSSIYKCDVLLFCHDVDRSITLNNQAYSPLIDSLKELFESCGYTCLSIAHPWSKVVGDAGYGSPIAINRSYLIAKIIDKLTNKFGTSAAVKFYERIIKKSNAKVVITIGCSNELCEAARNLKVFHAELLHGIGYKPMPWSWEKKDKKHLPQAVLTLDEVSTQTFSELEKHEVIIKEIPHPFLTRFQDGLDKVPAEWIPIKKSPKYKKEILVSLQWGYAPGLDEYDLFKGFLVNGLFYNELREAVIKTQNTVFWRFRFHPVQYMQPNKYKKLFSFMDEFVNKNKNCDWRESTYIPLPGLLRQCAGHITMNSMVSYEAAYLGVPTLALCPSLRSSGAYTDLFEDLVKLGYVTKHAADLGFILAWVDNVEKKEPLLDSLKRHEELDSLIAWFLSQAGNLNCSLP